MKMTIPYNITGKQRKQLAEDISKEAGFEVAYKRLIFLEPSEINLDQLKDYLCSILKTEKSPEAVLRNNSELKRLIRIYDFVKYHRKMGSV